MEFECENCSCIWEVEFSVNQGRLLSRLKECPLCTREEQDNE